MDVCDEVELIQNFNKLKDQWIEFKENYKPYWVMKHQIIGLCKDNVQAQKDFDLLSSNHLIRELVLPLSHNEVLLFFPEDFQAILRHFFPSHPSIWIEPLIEWLCNTSIWHCDNTISQEDLFRTLDSLVAKVSTDEDVKKRCILTECPVQSTKRRRISDRCDSNQEPYERNLKKKQVNESLKGGSVDIRQSTENRQRSLEFPSVPTRETIITYLMRRGFMRRLHNKKYCLTVPGTGLFVENLQNGRKSILRLLRKKKDEIVRNELFQRYRGILLKKTFLSMEYLLVDMEQLGLVKSIEGPSGLILYPGD